LVRRSSLFSTSALSSACVPGHSTATKKVKKSLVCFLQIQSLQLLQVILVPSSLLKGWFFPLANYVMGTWHKLSLILTTLIILQLMTVRFRDIK
jgi:hypothetical protein